MAGNQPTGPYTERNWRMLHIHMALLGISALAFAPLVFLDHWKIALALPIVIHATFEIYCRVQKRHAIYRLYGQATTVREGSEWSAEKFRDYFAAPDHRRYAQWWIQQFTHGFLAMGGHKGRDNRDAKGSLRIRTRNFRQVTEPAILASMQNLTIGSQPNGPRAKASSFRQSGMAIPSITREATHAMALGVAGLCWIGTGEGGLWDEHLAGGPETQVEFQIGTAYFGCRNPDGTFNLARLIQLIIRYPQIVAIQIKLSQGAKQDGGKGPGWKIDEPVAEHRGIEPWKDCFSPPTHSAFIDAKGLAEFVRAVREATGRVVGVKMAIGSFSEFDELCRTWVDRPEGRPDYLQIDGGEAGTGAAYEEVMKCAGLDTSDALQAVHILLTKHGLREDVRVVGSGGGFMPEDLIRMYALGADIVATGRGFKYMVGCIGASKCHIGRNLSTVDHLENAVRKLRGLEPLGPRGECPTGIASNGNIINPVERARWVRAAVTAEFTRTAHLLSMIGVSDYRKIVGTGLRHVEILGVRVWTPAQVEEMIAIEQIP